MKYFAHRQKQLHEKITYNKKKCRQKKSHPPHWTAGKQVARQSDKIDRINQIEIAINSLVQVSSTLEGSDSILSATYHLTVT